MSKIVVIDWGPQPCTLEGESVGGRTYVHKLTALELGDAAVGHALAAYSDTDVRVVGLVGRSQVVLRNLSVPDAAAPELAGIVRFQAMRELSCPVDQAAIDFEPLGAGGHDGSPRVTLAALQRNVVSQYQRAVASANGELRRLGLRPWATWRAFRQVAAKSDGAVLLVHLAGEYLELTVGRGEKLLFSHATFLCGGTSGVVGEVRRILGGFANQSPDIAIQRIALPAGPNDHQELVDALAVQLGLPVERFDPFQAVELSPELRTDLEGRPENRAAYAAVLGAALSAAEDWPIDFVNPKQPVTPRNRRRPLAALAATAATLLVAGGYVFANQQLARVNAQIKLQSDQQEKLQRSLAAADDVSHEYQALADWTQGDTDCLAELRRLSAEYFDTRQIHLLALTVTPDAAPDGAHRIMLDGAARSEMLIAEFHTKLNRSGHYSAQLIGAVQADGRGGDYRYSFKTSLTVRPRAAGAPSPLGERAGVRAGMPE